MPRQEPIDHTGKTYGRWTALSFVRVDKKQHSAIWRCRCDCGVEREVASSSFSQNGTKSCGCFNREVAAARQYKHGRAGTSTFKIWCAMRERCSSPRVKAYKNYGARGISVCERWESFENFIADMGERPDGLTLERKNNLLGYSKDNCVWATPHAQARNKRNNILVCWDDHVMVLKDAAKHFGVNYQLAHNRIRKLGWSVSDALTKAA